MTLNREGNDRSNLTRIQSPIRVAMLKQVEPRSTKQGQTARMRAYGEGLDQSSTHDKKTWYVRTWHKKEILPIRDTIDDILGGGLNSLWGFSCQR